MSDGPEQFRELSGVRQHADEPKRRWFFTPAMGLIVWVDELDRPFKFQLCYDMRVAEYALTWETGKGFNHALVDGGEGGPGINRTPILCSDQPFDKSNLLPLFEVSSSSLPTSIGSLVSEALMLYPSSPIAAGKRPMLSPAVQSTPVDQHKN